MDEDNITIHPTQRHTHTIIFLHGRGDIAHNFAHSLQYSKTTSQHTLYQSLSKFRWIFPKAPLSPVAASPLNQKQSQWFDIWDTRDFSIREDHQITGLRESVLRIRELVLREVTLLGGRCDRVVLAGISQGAATAVHTLLNLDLDAIPVVGERRLAAFLGFCCRLPFPGRTLDDTRTIIGQGLVKGDELLRNTPVLLEHSRDDPTVPVHLGQELRDNLQRFGSTVTWKEYENGGHWFQSPKGMDDVVEFLNVHVLGPMTQENERLGREAVRAGAMDLD